MLRSGASAQVILERLLDGVGMGEVSRVAPRFDCPCSVERVRGAARLLGREELRDVVEKGEPLELRCAFCAEVYRLSTDEVGSLIPDS